MGCKTKLPLSQARKSKRLLAKRRAAMVKALKKKAPQHFQPTSSDSNPGYSTMEGTTSQIRDEDNQELDVNFGENKNEGGQSFLHSDVEELGQDRNEFEVDEEISRKMVQCYVPLCRHYSLRETCRFFRFPRNLEDRRTWIKLIRREDSQPSLHVRICSCHFVDKKRENGPTLFHYNTWKHFEKQRLKALKSKSTREYRCFHTSGMPKSKPRPSKVRKRTANSLAIKRLLQYQRLARRRDAIAFNSMDMDDVSASMHEKRKEASCREDIDATTAKKRKCDPSSTTTTFLDSGGAGVDQHPQFLFVDADAAVKYENEYTEHEEKPNVNEDKNICIKNEVKEENEIEEPSAIKIESSLSNVSTHTLVLDNITKTYSDQSTSIKTEYTRHEQKRDVSDQENYWVKTEVKEEIEIEECSLNSETFIM